MITTEHAFHVNPTESVCFTGHRMIPHAVLPTLRERLRQTIRNAAQTGYRDFLCGGALGFDTIAAEEVLSLRESCHIRLSLVLPCENQSVRWQAGDQRRYQNILQAADQSIFLAPAYYEGCMMARNAFMVDHASLCVCWLYTMKGGAFSTVRYAWNRNIPLINLAISPSDATKRGPDQIFMREPVLWNSMFIFPSASKNARTAILPPLRDRRHRWRYMSTH